MFLCIECRKNLDESNFYRNMKNTCKDCLIKTFKCDFCGKFCTKKGILLILSEIMLASPTAYVVSAPRTNLILIC